MFHDVPCNHDKINETLLYRITEFTHHGVHTSLKCTRTTSVMLFACVHNNSCRLWHSTLQTTGAVAQVTALNAASMR